METTQRRCLCCDQKFTPDPVSVMNPITNVENTFIPKVCPECVDCLPKAVPHVREIVRLIK